MLVRERQRIPIDQTNSYLQYRTIIVDWMCEVAEEFKLNPYAVQLSVHYFDLALQRVKVKKSQLQLVAMCCTLLAGASLSAIVPLRHNRHATVILLALLYQLTKARLSLAAKFYGPEERVPPIADLNACSKNTYDREKIVRMEVVILGALQWVTAELTPLHFVDHFLALRAVQLADTIDGVPLYQSEKLDKIPRRLRQFAEFFVRLVLEDHSFYKFLPSLIGVSAIATSRYVLCLRPVWPESLAAATGYDEAELRPCLQAILLYSSKRFPNKFVPIAGTADTSASPKAATPAVARVSPVASPVDTPTPQGDSPMPMSGEPKRQAWTVEAEKNPRGAVVAAAIESAATAAGFSTVA